MYSRKLHNVLAKTTINTLTAIGYEKLQKSSSNCDSTFCSSDGVKDDILRQNPGDHKMGSSLTLTKAAALNSNKYLKLTAGLSYNKINEGLSWCILLLPSSLPQIYTKKNWSNLETCEQTLQQR
eukprot:m.48290 g.48290  ORF g.48290 m.48290 type:complete len:124 (-) comp10561_c0_seq5:408-779(-)